MQKSEKQLNPKIEVTICPPAYCEGYGINNYKEWDLTTWLKGSGQSTAKRTLSK
jgi:hypothetical protein